MNKIAISAIQAAIAGQQLFSQDEALEAVSSITAHLFASRDVIHHLHFTTKNGEKHRGYDEYYSGIIPLADKLQESVMGRYSCAIGIDFSALANAIAFFSGMKDLEVLRAVQVLLDEMRSGFPSEIGNVIDEINELINGVCYKLENLQ